MKHSLKHYCLLAAPHLEDDFFAKTLIYIARHDHHGAYGLVINRPAQVDIKQLFSDLDIPTTQLQDHDVLVGGPVRPEAGFVLHTGQPHWHSSIAIGENFCLTTSKDILDAIASNQLKHFQLALGYCSWDKHQLEQEIAQGDWHICPIDMDLLFHLPYEQRWEAGYKKANINRLWLAEEVGHA